MSELLYALELVTHTYMYSSFTVPIIKHSCMCHLVPVNFCLLSIQMTYRVIDSFSLVQLEWLEPL